MCMTGDFVTPEHEEQLAIRSPCSLDPHRLTRTKELYPPADKQMDNPPAPFGRGIVFYPAMSAG
jgi:hypothetical protein